MNDRTLYLHIGLPKTGSSALQVFFAKNARLLYQKGIRYPGVNANVGSRELITSGNAARFALRAFAPAEGEPEESARAIAMVERALAAGDRDVLLSSEYFASWKAPRHQALRELAGKHGFRTKVIAYLRDQGDITVTHYFQRVKRRQGVIDTMGGGFRDFARSYSKSHYLDFNDLLEMLAGVHGRESVTVGTSRRSLLVGNDLFIDALAALGLDPDGFDLDIPKINPTPSQQEMYVRAIMGIFDPPVEFSDVFLKTVATIHERLGIRQQQERNFFIDPEEVAAIRARFADGNREVCARWFGGRTPDEVLDIRTYGPKETFDTGTADLTTIIAILGGMMVEFSKPREPGSGNPDA
jgi:hypothetical protein